MWHLIRVYTVCSLSSIFSNTSTGSKIYFMEYDVKYGKELTLSTLGKIFRRQHFEIFFLIFPTKQDLALHANCCMKCQILFSAKLETYQFVVCWISPESGNLYGVQILRANMVILCSCSVQIWSVLIHVTGDFVAWCGQLYEGGWLRHKGVEMTFKHTPNTCGRLKCPKQGGQGGLRYLSWCPFVNWPR